MNNLKTIKTTINYFLIIWIVIWTYFAAFNWAVFTVSLKEYSNKEKEEKDNPDTDKNV